MKFLVSVFLLLPFFNNSIAQDMTFFFQGENLMSVSQTELETAKTLSDLHSRYKAEWVESYISTKITKKYKDIVESASGKNHMITEAQQKLLNTAEVGSEITVWVNYIPKNTLSDNSAKEMDYVLNVTPAKMARFDDTKEELDTYINRQITSKLNASEKELLRYANVTFTVSYEGQITNIELTAKTENTKIDQLLCQAIGDMPNWKPSMNKAGERIPQTMEFYISNNNSLCMLPIHLIE